MVNESEVFRRVVVVVSSVRGIISGVVFDVVDVFVGGVDEEV